MNLFDRINFYLTDELLSQLAAASALPVAVAQAVAAAAVPALVRQLAQPTSFDEMNARWAMCRQLYISQLLTQPSELLRTDFGWPERRQLLTDRLLGTSQVAALATSEGQTEGQPAAASTLLGYLTALALAVVGEQASTADLTPADTDEWLVSQQVPKVPAPAAQLLAASPKGFSKLAVVLGGVVVASVVGSHWGLGSSAQPPKLAAPAVVKAALISSGPAVVPVTKVAAPVPDVAAAPAAQGVIKAAPLLAVARSGPARPAVATPGVPDTASKEKPVSRVEEKPAPSGAHDLKSEEQPLLIKLPNQATLAGSPGSAEDLLYERLGHPELPQPVDVALSRLRFELSQARPQAEGAQQLSNVASILQLFPKVHLIVVGHANIREAQAIRLGLQRANLAVEELVKLGVAADRLQAQGMLSTELASSKSAEKQAAAQGITLKVSRL